MFTRGISTAVGCLVVATMAAGCGGGSAATPSSSVSGATVMIHNFSFEPSSITVVAGSTVRWSNVDQSTHTVTASAGGFDTGDIPPGSSASITFRTPGTFTYRCNIHQYMTGTVTVTAP